MDVAPSMQVQVLAPEVVQALVEHCSALGRPDRVERCVLHLDVTSLDLDQVSAPHLDHVGEPGDYSGVSIST